MCCGNSILQKGLPFFYLHKIFYTLGVNGEIYNISSHQEIDNLSLVKKLCDLMQHDEKRITFVNDRPGHDFRYGVDTRKIEKLGWQGNIFLDEGLAKTVSWYNKAEIN